MNKKELHKGVILPPLFSSQEEFDKAVDYLYNQISPELEVLRNKRGRLGEDILWLKAFLV